MARRECAGGPGEGRTHALACIAPFAAIAAFWLGNQLVGYFLFSYPWTANSFAWGAALGAATHAGKREVLAPQGHYIS